jgi:site-specific DNA recombinase
LGEGAIQVVGYVRVSTEDQAREGVSLAAQQAKIEAYAMVKDWTVGDVVRDEGLSAKTLNRPGLKRLLELVEQRQVQAVIVYKLDRLTRSVKDLNSLVELFDKKGVALVSLQESLDATTATGRLMMNLLASVSQWEREVIGERTRDAMQHLKAQGQIYSRPVFGEHADDAATLTHMQAMHAQGASYHAIADRLNTARVPTVRGGCWRANAGAANSAASDAAAGKEGSLVADEKLLTPEEVAERVQVAHLTVMGWLRKGKLKGVKAGRFWRIRERDLEAFLETQPPRAPSPNLDAINEAIERSDSD